MRHKSTVSEELDRQKSDTVKATEKVEPKETKVMWLVVRLTEDPESRRQAGSLVHHLSYEKVHPLPSCITNQSLF